MCTKGQRIVQYSWRAQYLVWVIGLIDYVIPVRAGHATAANQMWKKEQSVTGSLLRDLTSNIKKINFQICIKRENTQS
jgi:hypothetical protein